MMDVSELVADRPRLVAIAARILGSSAEADDVVQEAWLRLSSTDGVDDPPAWLTTVVTRLCLDQLRKQGTRSSAESEVPAEREPVDPEADALVADRVGGAMQAGPSKTVCLPLTDDGTPLRRHADEQGFGQTPL